MKIDLNYKGIEFQVEYDYQPAEPTIYHLPGGGGDPGCAAEAIVSKITHNGTCFFDFLEDQMNDVEEAILKQISDERE